MKICVIGGGPAGLMGAYFAKDEATEVVLLEKNEKVGKKLYITGKGRCNVTNTKCVGEEFLKNVVVNPKFLYSPINSFDYYDTNEFFQRNDCPLKVERGDRVFPVSDKSSDITKALRTACEKKGVKIVLNSAVKYIEKKDCFIIHAENGDMACDKVIIATGGKSYPTTGSTGDGYKFAKMLGHKIIEPKPSLVPIRLKSELIKSLDGLSLKNVNLLYSDGKKVISSFFGEAMFTDCELTGPIALSMSAIIAHNDKGKLFLDFKPALSDEQLGRRIASEIQENLNKDIKTVLKNLLPARFVEVFLNQCKIPETIKANSITKEQRQILVSNLKRFELDFDTFASFERAVVTTGGVDTREINAKTMESKLVEGLFFAGEVIDVDAFTGGYNIQIALSTGFVAGNSARMV